MTRGHVDVALLRFLRTRGDETVVLNAAGDPAAAEPDLAGALLVAARALVGDGAQDTVSYSRIAQSPAFARYRHLAAGLRGLDPATFEERRPRTAFWINLYNALVIDAVITFGVCRSIRESPGFFQRAAYQVGPYRLGLDEIEHGVLRGNKPLFARLP